VFEDDVRESRIIQTIPKRGYRLLVPVEPVNGTQGARIARPIQEQQKAGRNRRTLALLSGGVSALLLILLGALYFRSRERLFGKTADPPIHSLAVLPLQNLSADPAQEYFSDGMTDALITDLAQTSSLRVISRTSSMQYKETKKSLPEIARELNVDGIIEGTVQRSGDRVRITAQLIYAPSDKHLWANSYERDMRDAFGLEQDLAQEIADRVQGRIATPKQAPLHTSRPANNKAFDAYLQGNYHLTRAEWSVAEDEKRMAAQYFQQAIDADADFLPAYIGLANAHGELTRGSREDTAIRKRAAEKALALDPNSAEAWDILGHIKWLDLDWTGAEQDFRRAVAVKAADATYVSELGHPSSRPQDDWMKP
jgi:TolB-like protein